MRLLYVGIIVLLASGCGGGASGDSEPQSVVDETQDTQDGQDKPEFGQARFGQSSFQ